MKNIGILAFVLSVLFAGVVTWINLSWKSIKQFTNITSVSRINYYLSDFTLTNTDALGNISYQLDGEHMIHKQLTGSTEVYKPNIIKSSSSGGMLTIDAEKAIQLKKGDNILLSGDVKAVQHDADGTLVFTLLTQDLTYNPNEQKLSSEAKSDFIGVQATTTGVGFDTMLDDQEIRIHSNVQSEFKMSQ